MASVVENSNENADGSEVETASNTQVDFAELEQGRVWRRGNTTSAADKQKNTGPVLRTTVKPVKRFRPDSNSDKTNPSPSRKKRLKSSGTSSTSGCKSDENSSISQTDGVAKPKIAVTASSAGSPDKKATSVESDKNEKCNSAEVQAEERKDVPVKKKRVWEQWTVEDKNYFFEAVAMYGKDFEAIRTAIAQKHRKKGEECVAKTKDQVRHLYYRTWTMISKIIDANAYPVNINKAFQELYAVINYGELRKKIGGNLKKKGIEKLNELIRDGTTSTRFKGKNFRIKTPSCRALKKMNPEYQGKEGIHDLPLVSDTRRMKIPLHVTIELSPLTMAAWNQVHSIAHNPRLRIRLSVESPLSSVFAFLEKKWKSLSGRMMSFLDQGQLKSHSSMQKMSKNPESHWDGTLVLQTPPDASVNTRIMVFQVVNNKAHCVVSYALRKSAQATSGIEMATAENESELEEKKANCTEVEELPENSKLQSGCLSESEAVDSCLSSEEEYDYDSANEDASKDNSKLEQTENVNCSPKRSSESLVDSRPEIQTLDTSFTLKDKDSTPDSSNFNSDTSMALKDESMQPFVDYDALKKSSGTSVSNNHSLSAICNLSEESAVEEDDAHIQAEGLENIVKVKEKSSSTSDSASLAITEENTVKNANMVQEDISCDSAAVSLDLEHSQTDKNKKGRKLLVSSKLFGEPSKGKRQRNTKKNKTFIKAVQKWNANDCGKTTVAEVYMMLGKPSVFRLCYHWLKSASQSIENNSKSGQECRSESSVQPPSFSAGLAALIQAASLSHVGDERKTPCSEEMRTPRIPKLPAVKTKSTAVQCDIMKSNHKIDEKHRSQTSSTSITSPNPHGRGISKIIPVETVIVDNLPISGFAVPAVPINRPRRIAANPNKPVQGTKVSAETMNWLLQRERSRSSRMFRRPIVVDRSTTARSNRANNRPMKTFSIVTKGPNKIGFLPSQPLIAPKVTTSNTPDTPPSSRLQSSTATSSSSLDQLLHDSNTFTTAVSTEQISGNLLMQAAKEAGVAPPTPVKTSEPDAVGTVLQGKTRSDVADVLNESSLTVVPSSVPPVFGIGQPQVQAGRIFMPDSHESLNEGLVPDGGVLPDEPLLNGLAQDIATPATNPMVCPTSSSASSPTRSLPSSLAVNPAVVNSLPELSWPGHDISSSAFPIMTETFIDKLVDGEADVVLSSLNSNSPEKQTKKAGDGSSNRCLSTPSPSLLDENSNGPPLSRMSFDLQMTPLKSSEVPIHPWTISTGSRDSSGLSNLLNTPQKIVPSDVEDSLDGLDALRCSSLGKNKNKRTCGVVPTSTVSENCSISPVTDTKSRLQDQNSSNFLAGADSAVDVHLQSLMNENSVDLVSKFQDLVRHTTECDELSALNSDENARDGHLRIDTAFQSSCVRNEEDY